MKKIQELYHSIQYLGLEVEEIKVSRELEIIETWNKLNDTILSYSNIMDVIEEVILDNNVLVEIVEFALERIICLIGEEVSKVEIFYPDEWLTLYELCGALIDNYEEAFEKMDIKKTDKIIDLEKIIFSYSPDDEVFESDIPQMLDSLRKKLVKYGLKKGDDKIYEDLINNEYSRLKEIVESIKADHERHDYYNLSITFRDLLTFFMKIEEEIFY